MSAGTDYHDSFPRRAVSARELRSFLCLAHPGCDKRIKELMAREGDDKKDVMDTLTNTDEIGPADPECEDCAIDLCRPFSGLL